MKTALIVIGVLVGVIILVSVYALCLVGKSADIIAGLMDQTHEEL